MRILLYSEHRYPSDDRVGQGNQSALGALRRSAAYPRFDRPRSGRTRSPGLLLLDRMRRRSAGRGHPHEFAARGRRRVPQHPPRRAAVDRDPASRNGRSPPPNTVFVSQSLAGLYGSSRYVRNGLDPDDYIYSETKDDYFLFLASMQGNQHPDKYRKKGLHVALELAKIGFRLIVAGTARDPALLEEIQRVCRDAGAVFVGDVRGRPKAELLAAPKRSSSRLRFTRDSRWSS